MSIRSPVQRRPLLLLLIIRRVPANVTLHTPRSVVGRRRLTSGGVVVRRRRRWPMRLLRWRFIPILRRRRKGRKATHRITYHTTACRETLAPPVKDVIRPIPGNLHSRNPRAQSIFDERDRNWPASPPATWWAVGAPAREPFPGGSGSLVVWGLRNCCRCYRRPALPGYCDRQFRGKVAPA